MIEHYKKPSVKFLVNKGNYNKLMGILSFQEENIVTEDWKEKASNLISKRGIRIIGIVNFSLWKY